MAGGKTRKQRPQWSDVRGLLHLKMTDAASVLNISTYHLKRLCRQNGFPRWPGKKIRYMKATGQKLTLEEMKETKKMSDEEMMRIHPPVTTRPPGELTTTLNLIDKVGLQYSNSE